MPESNDHITAARTVYPVENPAAALYTMRLELQTARDEGLTPLKWQIRLEHTPALKTEAEAQGVFEDDPSKILGINVLGSHRLLPKGAGFRLICEGDEAHLAVLALSEPVG